MLLVGERKFYEHVTAKDPQHVTMEGKAVTALNSTDIRSVQDNVATPVTAMMVTVCISTDALSSVLISSDLSDTNSFHQCC